MTVKFSEGRVYGQLGMQLRDVQTSGAKWLEGRAVPYDTPTDLGWFTEVMHRGMFKKSITEQARELPLLLFHDSDSLDAIIGVSHEWRDEPDGLWGVWRLSDAEHAQRAAQMAAEGLLGFMSVNFVPTRSDEEILDGDQLVIHRREARLLEVSLTPTPAYADAVVSKVRSTRPVQSRPRPEERPEFWADYARRIRAVS